MKLDFDNQASRVYFTRAVVPQIMFLYWDPAQGRSLTIMVAIYYNFTHLPYAFLNAL